MKRRLVSLRELRLIQRKSHAQHYSQDQLMKQQEGKSLKALSFFSGCMGLDLGLESVGIKMLLACEVDKAARETILRNRPNIALLGDIRDYSVNDIREKAGLTLNEEIDIIVGGPPCQAFSSAGKRNSFNDSRGNVFLTFINLIIQLQPRFAVIENVRGLLSAPLKHRPHSERGVGYPPLTVEERRGGALLYVLNILRSEGYGISFNLYNAANFGSPQSRERVFILCSRDGKKLPYLTPTHSEDESYGLPKWRTLRDALDGIPKDSHQYVKFPEKRLKYYRMLKPGQNWRNLPPELQIEALGKSYFAGGGKTGFYRRLDWDKPSPTLVTHPAMPATDLAHPEEDRPLSIQEYKRIQEIPDDWLIAGSLVEQYKQIGNAVPSSLGKAVGRTLIAHLHGQDVSSIANFPYSRYQNTGDISWEQEIAGYRGDGNDNQLTIIYENSQDLRSKTLDVSMDIQMQNPELDATRTVSMMTEKEILDVVFRESKVKRSSLLAECVYSIDRYLNIEEDELKRISWVDKSGSPEQMIKSEQIESLINHRNAYLSGIPEDRLAEKVREIAASFAHFPILLELLKNFMPNRKARIIAGEIDRIERINVNSSDFSGLLNSLAREERENVSSFFSQKDFWSYELLKSLDFEVKILTEALKLKAEVSGLESSILDDSKRAKIKIFILNNWFKFFGEVSFFDAIREAGFVENSSDELIFQLASSLFHLGNKNLHLLFLFFNETLKMKEGVPKIALEAISTGNPLMFRSLFLSFRDAQEFAVGGKLNSSLETKYGNLFESLMFAFAHCRGIYNGGVDVAVNENAFDIKSGPNVMNKSMVDAFSAKKILIERERLLPDLGTYKVALGYGKKENLNSFMAAIESDIIDGRDAWSTITGVKHSPELVFKIARLVPKFFGIKSLVGGMLGNNELHFETDEDIAEFNNMFDKAFSSIHISPEARAELDVIDNLL